ncbi:MAG: hypothetical protein JNK47_03485 [Mesorhizobium sp.]|nr:hypothetical protein [Mesorhizobium sp.]MBL8576265.1 hypothetical protein [Mesorhizobium sp.]
MKKVSLLALLVTAAVSTACSSTGQNTPAPARGPAGEVALSDSDRTAVETSVRSSLGQPNASFRTMIGQRDASGVVTVCGYFNSGSGDTPFIGTLGAGSFTVSNLGGATEQTIAVQRACHGRGIYI